MLKLGKNGDYRALPAFVRHQQIRVRKYHRACCCELLATTDEFSNLRGTEVAAFPTQQGKSTSQS